MRQATPRRVAAAVDVDADVDVDVEVDVVQLFKSLNKT